MRTWCSKTNIDTYHWSHIMCDRNHKIWHSIEVFPAGFISNRRATRLGTAKLAEEGDYAWSSSFLHIINVDPNIQRILLLGLTRRLRGYRGQELVAMWLSHSGAKNQSR